MSEPVKLRTDKQLSRRGLGAELWAAPMIRIVVMDAEGYIQDIVEGSPPQIIRHFNRNRESWPNEVKAVVAPS